MAKVLKISRDSYYKHIQRGISKREMENNHLKEKIKEIYNKSRKTYGSPRVYDDLIDMGYICGKNRVARIMREMGLRSNRYKKFKVMTTDSNHSHPISENILDRKFEVSEINSVWVSDLTYVPTNEGWLFLCIILDLFSRNIVGWSMEDHMRTEMVVSALNMAYSNRKPKGGLIFHSDRGTQYACVDFRKKLDEYKIISSMSRKGNCWDNAPAESFFSTLKMELVHNRKYNTRKEARRDIFEYIEIFYNRQRRHSKLGNISPFQFEQKYVA